ncbi:MAG: CapA family protein, partial [Anaerolineae bacterium]|nr:CapA family protein [Anaerolineae bacterium]
CRPEIVPPTPIALATIPAGLAEQAALNKPPTPIITPRIEGESVTESNEAVAESGEAITEPVEVTASASSAGIWRLGVAPDVPVGLAQEVAAFAERHPDQFVWVGAEAADVVVGLGDERPFATWYFAAAAPFATVADEVGLADLQAAWQGSGQPLVVDAATAAWLADKWGSASAQVFFVSPEKRLETVWQKRPSWTIIPFDELSPELKVLRLDGQSPIQDGFDAGGYGLQANVSVAASTGSAGASTSSAGASTGSADAVSQFLSTWDGPASNRDADKLTSVAVTGVTALVRATAYNMEQNGMLWPADDVGSVLQAADIAHISNEVSFAPDCPYPNPIGGTTFCSGDNTFELIKYIGTDVVELTGNHLNDWGQEYLARSMAMYEAEGMATYGGGRNVAEAAEPALFEHNGNKIAFVGCNSFGPTYAWAGEASAGAMPCDGSMAAQIRQLVAEGYLVIATLQGTEYYQYAATPDQQVQFKALADAGATAVSGSQGHHAQAFDLYNGAFIHYGLGNLFFDQMDQLGTRQTFVDRYIFYNGRLLSVDLWTGLIENYAKPRLMTPQEREAALTPLFQASGW